MPSRVRACSDSDLYDLAILSMLGQTSWLTPMMNLQEFFDRNSIIELSFFNFRNAITAAYFADEELRIQRVNENFRSFFPVLRNVTDAYFPDVLKQLSVSEEHIESFETALHENGQVLIPIVPITIDGEERIYSLLSTRTKDDNFSYLNGVQGQFIDRTREHELRMAHEHLLEEKAKDRESIKAKSQQLQDLANRLAKYLSPQVYDSLFAGDRDPNENFARKNLTIFFSDIAGFTDISDGMEPERLAFVINTYLSEMSKIAIENGGTIDKFIGDAVLVFFGDPETEGDANDAIKCARMALQMREKVADLQSLWQSKGVSRALQVRMGINTGFCTVGNFGSDQRMEYTVLGSPVNMAARLQGATEPDTILVSESTYLLIKDIADCTPAGNITPKGFIRPIETFILDGLKVGVDANLKAQPLTRVGRHVQVSIADPNKIREAIIELRMIQEEFEAQA